MLYFDQKAVADALPYTKLIDALADAFAHDFKTPARSVHTLATPGSVDATLLLMPAWQPGKNLGVKVATVFPDNENRGLASVQASYLLLAADSGQPVAVLDGTELTLRRTAAASALASKFLSRETSETLLMVGPGNLAPHLIAAHCAVRPVRRVLIWGRREERAEKLAQSLALADVSASVATSLKQAVSEADIVCCATLSPEPLISGSWLVPGQHLDLVGAFTREMREADHEAVGRASVFVDTLDGALTEAGEIIQSLEAGVIARADILADLATLVRGQHPGRTMDDEITLFKSVGSAIEDLAAASLVLQHYA